VSPLFFRACLIEGGLLALAIGLGWLMGLDPWATWSVGSVSLAWAGVGVLPPLAMLLWVLRSSWVPVVRLRERVNPVIQSFFGSWSVWELGVLAFVAGLSEEVLFRGVIQAGLTGWFGPGAGLGIAAMVFGFMHPITRLYVLLAFSIGLWMGLIWMWSGSLVAPVLAHGLYDFVALIWCTGRTRETEA